MIFDAKKPNTPNNRGGAGLDKAIFKRWYLVASSVLRGDKMRPQKITEEQQIKTEQKPNLFSYKYGAKRRLYKLAEML